MYVAPPSIATATVALVAGAATVVILPAPGAGFRYRIAAISIGISRQATGLVDATVQDSAGNQIGRAAGALSVGGVSGFYVPLPEPGVPTATNTSLQASFSSTVATGSGVVTIYYFVASVP